MNIPKNKVLLYGANGYTAQLILDYLPHYNLPVIICGRNEATIKPLSEQYKLAYKIIDLNNTTQLEEGLYDIQLVIHCAGPFIYTAKQMVEACIKTKTHYIDINGDISVFELIKTYDQQAALANIMLLPGAGFDVIPTDCIAAILKEKLPTTTHLKLAFANFGSSVSHGTAMTMIDKLGNGGASRKDHKIVSKPLGQETLKVRFNEKELFFMSIPWGDVSTAYYSTKIPNITTYTMVKPKVASILKFQFLFNWLLRMQWVKNIIRNKIKAKAAGPSAEQRQKAFSFVWGEATDGSTTIQTSLTCLDGYTLTAHGCLHVASKIMSDNYKAGYQTPSSAYGKKIITELPHTKML
jgi:short subunit dehydrogenase-like uncharacterized protein